MSDIGCESNAREPENHAIGVIEFGRSLRFAEVNGAKVIAAVDLPEPVLHALASLVDVVSQAIGEKNDRERQADKDRPRTMCRWHLGQIAETCSPCRSEEIGSVALATLLHLRTDKGPFSGEAAVEIADAVLAVLERRGEPGRDALALIDRHGCENVTGGRRCWDVGKERGARYGADAWCAPCIAHRALDGDDTGSGQ